MRSLFTDEQTRLQCNFFSSSDHGMNISKRGKMQLLAILIALVGLLYVIALRYNELDLTAAL